VLASIWEVHSPLYRSADSAGVMLTPIPQPQRKIFVIGYRSPEVTNLKEHQVRVMLDAAATGIPQRTIFVIGPEVTS